MLTYDKSLKTTIAPTRAAGQPTVYRFGRQRAQRYVEAMSHCPAARYLEVLPLLCWLARPEAKDWKVIDLGSGTGYLADFLEGVVDKVVRVDKSSAVLEAGGSTHNVVCDMCEVDRTLAGTEADVVTCLASFHHVTTPEEPSPEQVFFNGEVSRYWTTERYFDVAASQRQQADAVRRWCSLLKPGGRLALLDIPGYPDPAWDACWIGQRRHGINTRAYHQQHEATRAAWNLEIDRPTLERYLFGGPRRVPQGDPYFAELLELLPARLSMNDLIATYQLPAEAQREAGPMVPADFFDEIVDGFGAQRHFGNYPRESNIRRALEEAGMEKVRVMTLPTPWIFDSRETAAWFVHELFGLSGTWPRDAVPRGELERLVAWLDEYLGFYEDGAGRTLLYWQLGYFVAQKPGGGNDV